MTLPQFLRRSVRGKMLAVVLATTLLALLVNAAALIWYNVEDYRHTQVADVRTQAEILGRASAAALAFGDQREAQRDLGMLQARADVEAAALYSADGSSSRSMCVKAVCPRVPRPPVTASRVTG